MPLHDWSDPRGWDGVRHVWITELLRWIKPRLPEEYRAYIGSSPLLAVGGPSVRPDVGVRARFEETPTSPATDAGTAAEPDIEIAVATIDPEMSVYVERRGRLIAAVEVISPRNKDRPESRSVYSSRSLNYLVNGTNLVLVDVHRRPLGFSFAAGIAAGLEIAQPALPTPMAVAYRVGEPAATGGSFLAIWRRPMTVASRLPELPLPLTPTLAITLDLESTYTRAGADLYLD